MGQEAGISHQSTISVRNTFENSESHHDANVANGNWSTDNNSKSSWKSTSHDNDNACSAKEQRLKKKSKSGNFPTFELFPSLFTPGIYF